MVLFVGDLKRTKLGVFLFGGPTQAAPGESNDADDNQNNADNSSGFHDVDLTTVAVLESIE